MVISGAIGSREDSYLSNGLMSPDEAENYHPIQISSLDKAGVDMVCAMTLNEPDEAIGITRAAQSLGIPSAISFSLETDGKLLNGGSLKNAIGTMDRATNHAPAYYMINCANPTHFDNILSQENWVNRIRGVRANAFCKRHAELWQSEVLEDDGAEEFGKLNAELASKYRHLNIFGGCCDSNYQHVEEICKALLKMSL